MIAVSGWCLREVQHIRTNTHRIESGKLILTASPIGFQNEYKDRPENPGFAGRPHRGAHGDTRAGFGHL